ncbi:MAG: HAD-IIB family hydrolase [Myxococcaceae bacterium]|nr:HAD-IIB family hydrolase [Myxococcaceae bacterium]
MLPLSQADLSRVRAVFTDVDGTLTTKGQLRASTVAAIEQLVARRIDVVLVSGRPSGWGECWARQLPVAGVIVENGGLSFVRRGEHLEKVYTEPEGVRQRNRRALERHVKAALVAVKGARLSMDSSATEVDLAIDYAEQSSLGPKGAARLEAFLSARGVTAVRSSVHVNCWLGPFDKRTAVEAFLAREWRTRLRRDEARFVYVGDSFNDQPLFEAFPLSVGVANVRAVLPQLEHPPKFVTRATEGSGFGEVAGAVVRARRSRKARA